MELIDKFVSLREEFDSMEFTIGGLRDDAVRAVEYAKSLGLNLPRHGLIDSFDDLLNDIHEASDIANEEVRKIEEAEELADNTNPEGPAG